ncbi:MAG TPA: MFS transporter [Alphaproteobacteria bacterium]|nr:MFS transporter [Alphaproteobacteria bacterium]
MAGPGSGPHGPAASAALRWLLLAGVWLLYFAFGVTVASMAPLVHPIRHDLGMSDAAMGAVLGAWQLVYIGSAMPCGAALDRVGARWALFAGAVLMAASAALRAVATGDLSLFLAVSLFGLGGPLVSIGAPKVVSQWFEGKARGLAMGLYTTGPGLGNIVALSATNSLLMPLAGNDWRAVMLIFAGFSALSGVIWLAISLLPGTSLPAERAEDRTGTAKTGIFLTLLREPAVRIVLVMSVGIFFFNHGLNNWLPEILRRGGLSATAAGYWASIPTAVGIAASIMIPRAAIPARRHAVLLGLILSAGVASLLLQATAHPGWLATGLVLQGLARNTLMTVAMLVLVEMPGVGSRNAGAAGGLFFAAAEIGGVLGPLTLGTASDLSGSFVSGLYLLTADCVLLALLLGGLWRLTPPRPATSP